MDQDQKKLVRFGVILLLVVILQNVLVYRAAPRKRKPRLSGARGGLSLAQKSGPSPQPKRSASASPTPQVTGLVAAVPSPEVQSPVEEELSPSPQPSLVAPEEEFEEQELEPGEWLRIIAQWMAGLLLAVSLFLLYGWRIKKQKRDALLAQQSESDLEHAAGATGVMVKKTSAEAESPLPSTVYVSVQSAPQKKADAVLIEEDPAVCQDWERAAKAHKKTLLVYRSIADFMKEADGISTGSDIYLDLRLGTGMLGEPRSKRIYDAGFQRIFLTTSEPLTRSIPAWVAMIVSKNPPWA